MDSIRRVLLVSVDSSFQVELLVGLVHLLGAFLFIIQLKFTSQ